MQVACQRYRQILTDAKSFVSRVAEKAQNVAFALFGTPVRVSAVA